MPYNKTTWVNGDIITAAKLNNIEDGLEAIVNDFVTPEMYGAVGDGVTDDVQALRDCFASGYPIFIPKKTYATSLVIPSEVATMIISDGGTIKFTGSYAYRILDLTSPNGCYVSGLTLDCNNKASCGIYFHGAGDCEVCKCKVHHTNNDADHISTCAGIMVRTDGAMNVHDNYCHDIYRSISNQGVIHSTGISTKGNGVANIYRNKISGVSCSSEDEDYLLDCDGISAYWETSDSINRVNIYNNEIIDCTTRAIKLQNCINNVKDNTIRLSGTLYSGGIIIDVQYGEAYVDHNDIIVSSAGMTAVVQSNRPIEGHENIIVKDNTVESYNVTYFVLTTGDSYDQKIDICGNDVRATYGSITPYYNKNNSIQTFVEVFIRNNKFKTLNRMLQLRSRTNDFRDFTDKLGIKIINNTASRASGIDVGLVESSTPFNFSSIYVRDNYGISINVYVDDNTASCVDFEKARYMSGYFNRSPVNMPSDFPYANYFSLYHLYGRVYAISYANTSTTTSAEGKVYVAPRKS